MKRNFILIFVMFSVRLLAQVSVPYFGEIQYLKGYQKEIAGDNIDYTSALPDVARTALLTRNTNGNMAIVWETEPLNFSTEQYVYFAMVAAHAQGTLHTDCDFDCYINQQRKFSFHLSKGNTEGVLHAESPNGEAAVFVKTRTDAADDEHGYLYLRIPTSAYKKGEPLHLKIVGQNQNNRDWFMIFKYSLSEQVDLIPLSLITKDNKQPLQVQVVHFGKNAKMHLTINKNEHYDFNLVSGLNNFEITTTPAIKKPVDVFVSADIDNAFHKEYTLQLLPVVPRTIHFIHHAHYDVGYSDLQEIVKKRHVDNIMNALRYIEQTKKMPWEARFKWNIETAYAVDNFLQVASAEQKKQFIGDVKDGYISIGGIYANMISGICQPEVLYNMTDFANRLAKETGIKVETAMMSDIPGLIWGSLPALARGGIKYFSDGPNYIGCFTDGDRIGWSSVTWKDKPFWWISPSGKEKILFWLAGKGYSSWHGTKSGDIFTVGAKKISNYMNELQKLNYPYDMVQWRYNIVADNGPTDSLISKFVFEWNQKYISPKIVLNTVDAMFKEFEQKYGKQIPSVPGDFSPYWEDGAYSTTKETVLNNQNSVELPNLSTLYAIAQIPYPTSIFNEAWKNILLWKEHTWGAYNSISDPDLPFVKQQWDYKKRFALDADSIIQLLKTPFNIVGNPDQIEVANTCSWNRSGLIYLNKNLSSIKDEEGNIIEMQITDNQTIFFAKDIPAMSSKKYFLQYSTQKQSFNKVAVNSLDNKNIHLLIDEKTGAIKQLTYKGFELVNDKKYHGLNQFYYVQGRKPTDAVVNNNISNLRLVASGKLFTTLAFDASSIGCNSIHTEITLYQKEDKIDIVNTIDKIAIREKESVHYAFPFNITDATQRFNTGWGGVFEPGKNQLNGSNQDYYCPQLWCDISNDKQGVSLLFNDVNLMEPGEILSENDFYNSVRVWKKEPCKLPNLFSYVMNNYWTTNYKADQDGVVSFKYTLVPHQTFELTEVQKKAIENISPLCVIPSDKGVSKSLFTLSNTNVVVSTIIPQDKGGYKIRLFNVNDQPENCSIYWNKLKPTKMKVVNTPTIEQEMSPNAVIRFSKFGIVDIEIP